MLATLYFCFGSTDVIHDQVHRVHNASSTWRYFKAVRLYLPSHYSGHTQVDTQLCRVYLAYLAQTSQALNVRVLLRKLFPQHLPVFE